MLTEQRFLEEIKQEKYIVWAKTIRKKNSSTKKNVPVLIPRPKYPKKKKKINFKLKPYGKKNYIMRKFKMYK